MGCRQARVPWPESAVTGRFPSLFHWISLWPTSVSIFPLLLEYRHLLNSGRRCADQRVKITTKGATVQATVSSSSELGLDKTPSLPSDSDEQFPYPFAEDETRFAGGWTDSWPQQLTCDDLVSPVTDGHPSQSHEQSRERLSKQQEDLGRVGKPDRYEQRERGNSLIRGQPLERRERIERYEPLNLQGRRAGRQQFHGHRGRAEHRDEVSSRLGRRKWEMAGATLAIERILHISSGPYMLQSY